MILFEKITLNHKQILCNLLLSIILFLCVVKEALGQSNTVMQYKITPTNIELLNQVFPLIECTLNGKKACFLVDTGSTITILDISQKKKYGFYSHKRLNKKLYGFGGKQTAVWSVLDVDLRIGDRFISAPFAGVPIFQLRRHIQNKTGHVVSGIIGADVIRDYGIIVDFVGEKCIIGVGKNMVEDILIDTLADKKEVH